MAVELGNLWYFLWMLAYPIFAAATYFLLRNRSEKFQAAAIYSIILLNFFIHFAWPLSHFETFNERVARMFLINHCAALVVLGPFLFFSKDSFLKPGFVYAAMMGGFLVSFYPGEAKGLPIYSLPVLRFYGQHILLFTTGFLLVSLGKVSLNFKNIWALPVFMFFTLLLVVANLAILQEWGIIRHMRNWNMAFQWGPDGLEGLVGWLIPSFLRTESGFVPVLWQLPLFLTIYPLFGLLVLLIKWGLGKIKMGKFY